MTDSSSEWIIQEDELNRLLEAWVDDVVSFLQTMKQPAIFGIRTRGVPLGRRVKSEFDQAENTDIPFGLLDITLYRDDLTTSGTQPAIEGTQCMFDVSDRDILLVDDVLFTGRTVRAAMDEIFDFGRPSAVRLAVLVDRGQRELPIEPNITGKEVEVQSNDMVRLRLDRVDEEHGILLE